MVSKPGGTHNDKVVEPVACSGKGHPFATQT